MKWISFTLARSECVLYRFEYISFIVVAVENSCPRVKTHRVLRTYRWNKSEMSTIMKTNDGCVFLCFDTPNEQIDIYSAIEMGTNPRLGSALQLHTMSGSIGNDK